jgi:UPF0755 protein
VSDPRPPEGPYDHDAPDQRGAWEPTGQWPDGGQPGPTGAARGDADDGYVDDGYVDDGYVDDGYADQGYADQGYADQGFADQGFADDAWDDVHEFVAVRPEPAGRSRWLVAALVLFAILAVGVLGAGWWVRGQIDPGDPGAEVALTIPTGATTADIARLLEEQGVIGNPTVFEWYLRFSGGGPFRAGDYQGLRENQAMGDVIEILDQGPIPPEIERVTFREGLWLAETRALILETFPAMDPAALDAALAAVRVPSLPEIEGNPEGVLFPATYDVPRSSSSDPAVLVDQMLVAFDRVSTAQGLPDATARLQGVAGDRAITPYEALIVASMVEAEARTDEDRPKIARVIYNRIKNDMRLDIDATVLYALGERLATLTQSQLDVDSPYNTRRFQGIPPTPINSPGEASIQAALNPAEVDWLYYVLADEDGSHYFTEDFDDFNRAVRESRDKGLL